MTDVELSEALGLLRLFQSCWLRSRLPAITPLFQGAETMHVYVARIFGAGTNNAGKVTRLFQDKGAAQAWLRSRLPETASTPRVGRTTIVGSMGDLTETLFELKRLKVN